jgi:diguanylate cyclase (GGDEF)-like protein
MERLRQALAHSRRDEGSLAVLFVDLDNFKIINDSLGHTAGDRLLVEVARRLENCLRSEDTVARFGGDEFVILLEQVGEDEATLLAERITEQMRAPFTLEVKEVFVGVTLGITVSHTGQDSVEDLIRHADTAMYWAKSNTLRNYEVFEEIMSTEAINRLEIGNELPRAIERGEFALHYQPIVDLASCSVISMEALLRWEHPERGLLSPTEFIPLAEQSGLVNTIGQWVLEEACNQRCSMRDPNPHIQPQRVSVNLSPQQLKDPRLAQSIIRILEEIGMEPDCLELEITESAVVEDEGLVPAVLYEIKDLGVRLAIDDFGTGYSSLAHLKLLPVDTLKIDRSFINNIARDQKDELIVSATASIAQSMGIEVVAEGIETTEQFERLRELGCELGQGYLFSKPVTAEEISQFIESRLCQ